MKNSLGLLAMLLIAIAVTAMSRIDDVGAAMRDRTECQPGTAEIGFGGDKIFSANPISASVGVELPQGAHLSVVGTSNDSYPERATVTQTAEVWKLEALDSDGTVVWTSGASQDMPDMVETATWSGSLGETTLVTSVASVRAVHAPDSWGHNDQSPNSVIPSATLSWTCPVIATTTTTTTTIPEKLVPATNIDREVPPPASPAVPVTPAKVSLAG